MASAWVLAAKATCLSDTVICDRHKLWLPVGCTPTAAGLPLAVEQWAGRGEWGGSAWQVLPFGSTREASAKHLLPFPHWGHGWRLLLSTSEHQLMKPLKSVSLWIFFHANYEIQCHFHSLPKVPGLVNKSPSLLDGNLQASVAPSWIHQENSANVGDYS